MTAKKIVAEYEALERELEVLEKESGLDNCYQQSTPLPLRKKLNKILKRQLQLTEIVECYLEGKIEFIGSD